ncbi:MAG: hypothetical protein ACLQIB_31405 [Isosphaeraceae bacterium]
MRSLLILAVLVAYLGVTEGAGLAQDGPKLHDLPAFFKKGGAAELDADLLKHRLSQEEIEKANLSGESTDVKDALRLMAKYEKLEIRIPEPFEVRGPVPVYLPPNTMGDEAYTACFVAFTYNGLALSATGPDLELVRPQTRPGLARPSRPWNRQQVLSTRLYRLGYLKPDPIMRHYKDRIGTPEGHAILQPKSNVLIVIDAAAALVALQEYIDIETLEAMGVPASQDHAAGDEPRPPSLGAIASLYAIHFYLTAFARVNQIPLFASEEKGVHDRYYREADLWTNERGFRALESEYRRINEFVKLARETGGQGWEDPDPRRTFQPIEQRKFEIRFGVIIRPPARGATTKNKKDARKRS